MLENKTNYIPKVPEGMPDYRIWLRENIRMKWVNLTSEFNRIYGTTFSINGIRHLCAKNNISKTKEIRDNNHKNAVGVPRYTPEQKQRLIDNHDTNIKEKVRLFNETFGTSKTEKQISGQTHDIREQTGLKLRRTTMRYKRMNNQEFIEFVKSYSGKIHLQGLINLCQEKFGKYNDSSLDKIIKSLNIELLPEPRIWTPEMIAVFEKYNSTLHDDDIAEEIFKATGRKLSRRAVSDYRNDHYQHKQYRIFSKRVSVDGKVLPDKQTRRKVGDIYDYNHRGVIMPYIKTENGKMPYRNYMYEKYYGRKLADDEFIMQLDGNLYNFEKNNLVAVNRQEFMTINAHKRHGFGMATKAGLETIRSDISISEKFGNDNSNE